MADAVSAEAPPSPGRRLGAPLAASAVLAAATVYTAVADPYRSGFFPACPWLHLTGLWCPGCGGLRAVHELAHGDVAAALALNPFAVLIVIPVCLVLLGAWWRAGWKGRAAPAVPLWAANVVVALAVAFWVLRNIPALEPFLAP
ncbi:DUF2752 domain-containing protein [Demequina sp. NBRC 110057]|uniref:DUF2752 domain-containing protein n=1 Tax=Demequina sp. NBRC 110057 TaxID=1570346 RepID=UPI000A01E624|nr:DUF2752 domain-containing protein [Demequina sp. NBRC 110057]